MTERRVNHVGQIGSIRIETEIEMKVHRDIVLYGKGKNHVHVPAGEGSV